MKWVLLLSLLTDEGRERTRNSVKVTQTARSRLGLDPGHWAPDSIVHPCRMLYLSDG